MGIMGSSLISPCMTPSRRKNSLEPMDIFICLSNFMSVNLEMFPFTEPQILINVLKIQSILFKI